MTPQERKFLLDQVAATATSSLAALWARASDLDSAAFYALMVQAFPEFAAPYVELSAQMSATWFELSAPASPYVAVTAPPIPAQRLVSSAEWALGASGEDALARMEGTLQRAVYDGARDTTMVNVERTGSRWARHANPDACAFCRMLATRGAVYRSAESATKEGGWHDHCRCIAVEVREGQTYEPPDYVQEWETEYLKARANAGSGDPQKILAAWRQQGVR